MSVVQVYVYVCVWMCYACHVDNNPESSEHVYNMASTPPTWNRLQDYVLWSSVLDTDHPRPRGTDYTHTHTHTYRVVWVCTRWPTRTVRRQVRRGYVMIKGRQETCRWEQEYLQKHSRRHRRHLAESDRTNTGKLRVCKMKKKHRRTSWRYTGNIAASEKPIGKKNRHIILQNWYQTWAIMSRRSEQTESLKRWILFHNSSSYTRRIILCEATVGNTFHAFQSSTIRFISIISASCHVTTSEITIHPPAK